ncbi:MAG: hypothetical protein ACE14L_09220 [Terriglobales bacterium]
MSTTIFTARQYNPEKERRKRQIIVAVVCAVIIVAALLYTFRNWTYERRVDQFFSAIQQQDYKKAYGIWMNDPAWEQHPQKYTQYPFDDFYRDWGPGGEWGLVKTYKVVGSARPKGGSGVIVVVRVNDRVEQARLWVEKKDKTLTWSPY